MNRVFADKRYSELREYVKGRSGNETLVTNLGRLLEKIVRGGKSSDQSLFDVMNALFQEHNPGELQVKRAHNSRMCYNAVKHRGVTPTDIQCKELISICLELVSFYSGMPVPQDLGQYILPYNDSGSLAPNYGEVARSKSRTNVDRRLDTSDLVEATAKRLPVVICLDISGSMANRLKELQQALLRFSHSMAEHPKAKHSVELALVSFNTQAHEVFYFAPMSETINKVQGLQLMASGQTAMGAALMKAMDMLEERKLQYKDTAVPYYQPWLVLMTDGEPTDLDLFSKACARVESLAKDEKLHIIPCGIGGDYNRNVLQMLCTGFVRNPLRVHDTRDLTEFFEFLRNSVEDLRK